MQNWEQDFVVVLGTLRSGFQFFGPFVSETAASDWAAMALEKDDYVIAPLHRDERVGECNTTMSQGDGI